MGTVIKNALEDTLEGMTKTKQIVKSEKEAKKTFAGIAAGRLLWGLLFAAAFTVAGVLGGIGAEAASTSQVKDYEITEAYWDDSQAGSFIARWEKPIDKTSYKVQLYRGNVKVGKEVSTGSEKYDFTSRIVDKGSGGYYFIVYAVKDRSRSKQSDLLEVDYDTLADVKKILKERERVAREGREQEGGKGVTGMAGGPGVPRIFDPKTGVTGWNRFEEKWWWKKADGTAAMSEWIYTGDKWYYLGEDHMMRTGWLLYQDKWYYLGADGAMLTATVTPDGYTLSESGEWIP